MARNPRPSAPTPKKTPKTRPASTRRKAGAPILLSGGNPQIAKADGEAPVQAYLAAIPGWKRDVGRRIDALIVEAVPGVRKAVRWNSPFYGIDGQGWFLGMHCLARYLKISFFNGALLVPRPPVASKKDGVRYLHLHEHDPIDETRLRQWLRQAAALPGMQCF